MTFYHFGNCIALAYLPYYLAYKHSGLSEYGAFWKCIQAGFLYALTQLCKMLILATFFPVPTSEDGLIDGLTRSPPLLEFFKTSIDLADLFGIYIVLNRIPGRGHSKILTAAIGWGTADLILTKFLAIWVGAKGVEFDWKYIQQSLDANINLIQHVGTTALVWLWTRHDLKQAFIPVVACLLVLGSYKGLLIDIFMLYSNLDAWSGLIIKSLVTGFLAILTIRVYSSVAGSSEA